MQRKSSWNFLVLPYICVLSNSVVSNSLQSHGLYVAHQAPLSMEFSRQEYWSGLPFPPPGDLLNPGIKPEFFISPALAGRFFTIQFSSVQSLSCVLLFVTPWTAARHASLSITNYRSLPKLMSIKLVTPSNHLSSVIPFSSCHQSFPTTVSFQMSQLFTSGGQSIGVSVSTSVLPMNTQDWSPLGWTGWISLQSKGLSRVFSNTTVQKHQFFGSQLSSQSNSHIHTWPLEKP